MASSNFRINKAGFRKIRSAPRLMVKNEQIAERVAAECNRQAGLTDGYRTSSREGAARPQGRHRTTVITATRAAQRDNAQNNRLLKVFESHGKG